MKYDEEIISVYPSLDFEFKEQYVLNLGDETIFQFGSPKHYETKLIDKYVKIGTKSKNVKYISTHFSADICLDKKNNSLWLFELDSFTSSIKTLNDSLTYLNMNFELFLLSIENFNEMKLNEFADWLNDRDPESMTFFPSFWSKYTDLLDSSEY